MYGWKGGVVYSTRDQYILRLVGGTPYAGSLFLFLWCVAWYALVGSIIIKEGGGEE